MDEPGWIYKDKLFDENLIGDNYGFVYKITNMSNGKSYIGKKFFYSKYSKKPLKGKKNKRHFIKESNWKTYWGSCKALIEDVDSIGKSCFKREILLLCPDKRETNYAEMVIQVLLNVLDARSDTGERLYYNENIMLKFYPSEQYQKERTLLHESYK